MSDFQALAEMPASIAGMRLEMAQVLLEVRAVRADLAALKAKPERETIGTAMETRGVGRRRLMDDIDHGRIDCIRGEPGRGGHEPYLMLTADLDRLYPTTK